MRAALCIIAVLTAVSCRAEPVSLPDGKPKIDMTDRFVPGKEAFTQLIALVTFFAFPAFQYILLKRYSKQEGRPELWYLPAYGFRLVIRNIPGKKTLSDLKYRAIIRDVVSASSGASAATWNDQVLLERQDFFLFPGSDQVLLSFQIERSDTGLVLIHTSKLGDPLSSIPLSDRSILIADYSANLENFFNFDIKLAKRVEIIASRLSEIFETIEHDKQEQDFSPSRVRDVG